MYLVIRRFNHISSVAEAARRAESGIGQLLKQCPGFQGDYLFDAGDGIGGSASLFDSKEAAQAANEKALAWIRGSLVDMIDGELKSPWRSAGGRHTDIASTDYILRTFRLKRVQMQDDRTAPASKMASCQQSS